MNAIEKRIAELADEAMNLQLSRPPVLTNAEEPEDETKIWNEIEALCEEHGIGQRRLEQIFEAA